MSVTPGIPAESNPEPGDGLYPDPDPGKASWVPDNPAHAGFRTGLVPTPRHKIAEAIADGSLKVFTPQPQVALDTPVFRVPKTRSMYDNDRDGICVSAEEAFNIASMSAYAGKEYKVDTQTVISFANKYNELNGADLLSVLQQMQRDGFHQAGDALTVGASSTVDFTNLDMVRAAVLQGNVKVATAASMLPSGAGNKDGWTMFGVRGRAGSDHCQSLNGYGTAKQCFDALGMAVPSGVDPNKPDCFLCYTWSTIGVIDFDTVRGGFIDEAYLRDPDSLLNGKPWVGPTPSPSPGPAGPLVGILTVTGPADAVGSYVLGGGGGLTPQQSASLSQAVALINTVLPAGGDLTAAEVTEVYRYVHERGLNPRVNWVQLIADIAMAAMDLQDKNWIKFLTVDVPALVKALQL